jgi:hypothetical protein
MMLVMKDLFSLKITFLPALTVVIAADCFVILELTVSWFWSSTIYISAR